MPIYPPPGKALPRFESSEIEYMLETGEIPPKFTQMLEAALDYSKEAPDGEVAVCFFIEHLEEEVEDAEEEAEEE